MEKVINVTVRDKIASALQSEVEYVCGNSDYVVAFDFDEEWGAFNTKTARFKYNGTHQDVVFTGDRVEIPVIENTHKIQVGVFAGNLRTTTPAVIMARKSILCGNGVPAAPSDDVYSQIMDLLNKGGASAEQIQAAVQDYFEKNPQPGVNDEQVREIAKALLEEAKERGEFDGPPGDPGASAYQIAVNAGFEGTEEEWLASLKGERYVLTPADKEEITAAVISALPIYDGEVVEE